MDLIEAFRHRSKERLMIAIAVGHPDGRFPANQILSEREPAENLAVWVESTITVEIQIKMMTLPCVFLLCLVPRS